MADYTPGPWRYQEKANARLISAAPNMLDTLRTTMHWLRRVQTYEGRSCDDPAVAVHLKNIEDAIAKAEGV